MDVRLGIGSYTFAWAIGVPGFPPPRRPLDAFGLLATGAKLGAQVLQVCDNLPLADLGPAELARLRGEAAEAGMVVEAGTRGTERALLERYVEIAAAVGSRVLRTLVSIDSAGRPALAEAEAAIRALLPELERRDLVLLLENYEHAPAAALRRLVDAIGSPRVRVCLDTVNNFGVPEDQERVLEALAAVTGELHVKDYRIRRADTGLGFVLEGTPAGEGRLDVAALLSRLAREGVSGPLSAIIELWTAWQGSIDATVALEQAWAESSVANLRRILRTRAGG